MKRLMNLFVALGLLSAMPVFAEKPDWAGKGKAAEEQLQTQRDTMENKARKERDEARETMDRTAKDKKVKKEKKEKYGMEDDDMEEKGLEKQREMKQEQERNELGKGSEQGQSSREEHSRKWWKIWD